jgi:hypothetical protein
MFTFVFFFKWRTYTQSLHPKDAHSFFIKLFTKALQEEYKYKSEATIVAIKAKSTRLAKGVTKNRANCPDHAPMHIIKILEDSPSRPTAIREHQPVQLTLSERHHMLYEVDASIFLEFIFRIGIHASNLPDLPSTPPRRQTASPPCMRPSSCARQRDPAAPCRRDPPLLMQ